MAKEFNVEEANHKEVQKEAARLGYGKVVGVKGDVLKEFILFKQGGDAPEEFDKEQTLAFLEEHEITVTGEESDEELQGMVAEVVNHDEELKKNAEKAAQKEEDDKKDADKKKSTPKPKNKPVEAPKQQVYQGKLVTHTGDRIISGRAYKNVHVSTGEVFTVTLEEFESDVRDIA